MPAQALGHSATRMAGTSALAPSYAADSIIRLAPDIWLRNSRIQLSYPGWLWTSLLHLQNQPPASWRMTPLCVFGLIAISVLLFSSKEKQSL